MGGMTQSQTDVTPYSFILGSTCTSDDYTQTPPFVLSNPDSTHIAIADTTEAFPTGIADYSFTSPIAIPGGAPGIATWFYVTITDPAQLGGINLPVNIETINAKVGVNGYTYVGAIQCLPAGGGIRVTPGGWPPPPGFQVGP
jgi:hypothetical protein